MPWTIQRLLMTALCLALTTALSARQNRVETTETAGLNHAQNTPAPGDSMQTMTIGGMQRTFVRYIPTGYDGTTPVPLVIVLHGKGGSGKSMEKLTEFSIKADEKKFIVVYPNGVGNPTIWNNTMNKVSDNGADDVAFLTDLIDRLQKNLRIDDKRIYMCGFSSGAVMTYLMAAKLSDRLAAVGVAAGSVGFKEKNGQIIQDPYPISPIAVIHFHGKMDTSFPYDGGDPPSHLSVAESIDFWTQVNGCQRARQRTPTQDSNITIDNYQGCRNKAEVILYTFANGIHEWPTPQNNDKFDATARMWQFFANHSKS